MTPIGSLRSPMHKAIKPRSLLTEGSRPAGAVVPLSLNQQRLWLQSLSNPYSTAYNESITIYKHGSFQLDILEASLNEIIKRHEALRTNVRSDGTVIIHDLLTVSLMLVDLSHLTQEDRGVETLRIAAENAGEPFTLDSGPLFRIRIVRINKVEHRCLFTFHHIVCDGISFSRVLVPELAHIYDAFEQGIVPELEKPTLQYGDFAYWSKTQNRTSDDDRRLAYWLKQLSGELPILQLPCDRERPASPSHKGAVHLFEVDRELTKQVRELSRQQRVSPYITLFTAFSTLLFRYSGQSDIIVGTPCDARNRTELEDVFGYFLNIMPIRTYPSAALSFTHFLNQVRETIFDGLEAADIPFDLLVRSLEQTRDTSCHPVFQAFFSMRPPEASYPNGWALSYSDGTAKDAKFDLYLEMMEKADVIEARFFYSSDLFDADTLSRAAVHLLTLLKSVCENPEATLSGHSVMGAEEHSDVLSLSQGEVTSSSVYETTIQALVHQHVLRRPEAKVARWGDKWLTYADLDRRTQTYVRELHKRGIGSGSVVVVALEHCFDLLSVILAVLSVRAAFLPLDTRAPRERIQECLIDAIPNLIVTHGHTVPDLIGGPFPVLLVEDVAWFTDTDKTPSDALFHVAGESGDSAYVIYTSGTTGKPKGVEVSQRSLVNLLVAMQHTPGFVPGDVMLALTTVSFDIATLELLLPLVSGGTVVLASRQESQDPRLLHLLIERSGCTVVQATPATWRTLLSSAWISTRPLTAAGLRIWCGGEVLTADLAQKLLATGAEVWNLYGPTETTIWSTVDRVLPQDNGLNRPVSVGRPIANTQAYIVGVDQELLPIGVPGILLIGGVGLAKGYRGDPSLTLERFCDCQYPIKSRLYLTGDRAVRKRDGSIEIKGRIDNQVKIRGHRVELEAVESIAERHHLVTAAAARTWPEPDGAARLALYLTVSGPSPSHTDLREYLASKIPEYMIPSDIVTLPSLPTNSSGKLDRSRLPKPPKNALSHSAGSFRTMTDHEKRVATLWSKLLPLSEIDGNDSFFLLGGHSLDVAALVSLIQAEFGLNISMAELFHKPTVRQQSLLIQQRQSEHHKTTPGVITLQPEGSGTPMYWIHYVNEGIAQTLGNSHPFVSVVLTTEDVVALGDCPTIESMAMLHVRKLLATSPTGPYRIGGFCVGGLLAYEVSSLLRKAGYDVSLLVLVDVPNSSTPFFKKGVRYGRWIVGQGGVRALKWSIKNRMGARRRGKLGRSENEMRNVQFMAEHAAESYRPPRYDGNVLLIQASERLHMDLHAAWNDVAPNVTTRYVDGHHDDLMKPENVHKVGLAILTEVETHDANVLVGP